MELELKGRRFTFSTVVEFFTKRGRPLTKEDIKRMQDEDRKLEEEEQEIMAAEQRRLEAKAKKELAQTEPEETLEEYQQRIQEEKRRQQAVEETSPQTKEDTGGDEEEYGDQVSFDDEGLMHMPSGSQSCRNRGSSKEARRLTVADYSHAQKKKGRYGITVPRPLSFEMRELTKSKSIRERRVEQMVMEKKVQEEMEYQVRPKVTPIPPEVLQPRFNAL
jgi:exonuclease VII large subunit